jgi:hypothetical protein
MWHSKMDRHLSPRQLLCHGTGMEIFRELVNEETAKADGLSEGSRANVHTGGLVSPLS